MAPNETGAAFPSGDAAADKVQADKDSALAVDEETIATDEAAVTTAQQTLTDAQTSVTTAQQHVTDAQASLKTAQDKLAADILQFQADSGNNPPAPAPNPPAPPSPVAGMTLYQFLGGDPTAIDTTQWTKANVVDDTGAALYTFVGDSAPGDQKGAGPDWVVYTGPTQPVAGTPGAGGGATGETPDDQANQGVSTN